MQGKPCNMDVTWSLVVWFSYIGFVSTCNQKSRRRTKDSAGTLLATSPSLNCEDETISFHVFSRKMLDGFIIDSNMVQLSEIINVDPKTDLKVIIHGWNSSGKESWVNNMKNAYLSRGDCNVVIVNWENIALCTNYLQTTKKTKYIGKEVAKFLEFLITRGVVKAEKIHLIGHSLGGHIAGIAGSAMTTELIGRITGLDIARPGFEWLLGNTEYLDAMDAEFVDIIHTTVGITGWVSPAGHVDFYPNRGVTPQPGCSREGLINSGDLISYSEAAMQTVVCSHSRAHVLFIESIYNITLFSAMQCPYDLMLSFEECDPYTVEIMGEYCSPRARGTFYLETNSGPPFAKG